MVRNAIACVLILCLTAGISFGQGFVTFVYETDTPLTIQCNGGPPIPDGVMYYLHQDIDSDGPDADDPLATLCDDAPNCTVGESGSLNWNALPFNGVAMGLGEGLFYPEYGFASLGALPLVNRFFIRVNTSGTVWTSAVFSPVAGYSEIELTGWTCIPASCMPNPIFMPNPTSPGGDMGTCAVLCPNAGGIHDLYIGPFIARCLEMFPNAFPPPIYFTNEVEGCTECGIYGPLDPLLVGPMDVYEWAEINGQYYIHTQIVYQSDAGYPGCVRIRPDYLLSAYDPDCWLPVEFGAFTAVPGDGEVILSWNTLSETDLNYFELARDGEPIHRAEATNTSREHHYRYADKDLINGRTYHYTLTVVNADNSREVLASADAAPAFEHGLVTEYALFQNYPNPFNPETQIRFDLAEAGWVSLRVYNLLGQEVAVLANGEFSAGRQTVRFDAGGLPSGLYLYRLTAGEFAAERKMLLLK